MVRTAAPRVNHVDSAGPASAWPVASSRSVHSAAAAAAPSRSARLIPWSTIMPRVPPVRQARCAAWRRRYSVPSGVPLPPTCVTSALTSARCPPSKETRIAAIRASHSIPEPSWLPMLLTIDV